MRSLGLLACASALVLAGCATPAQNVEMQRPALPDNQSLAWKPHDRLFQSVGVDYVKGMSQRSYLFSEGNQAGYRPMLENALRRAGMLAPTKTAARYGLQVDFSALAGENVGTDFTASSKAIYRLVDRSSGAVVFEGPIDAQFTAVFVGLNESDAKTAIDQSLGAVGLVTATAAGDAIVQGADDGHRFSQKLGRQYYQAAAWSLLWGPAFAGISFVNPFNFVALPNYFGGTPSPAQTREGALATTGFGARNGGERASQADYQIMAQGITKFVIAIAEKEHVEFTTVLPCVDSAEVNTIKRDLSLKGMPWKSDDCTAYSRTATSSGVDYTTYK